MAHYAHHHPAPAPAAYPSSYDPSDLIPFHQNMPSASSSHPPLDHAYLPTPSSSYAWNSPASSVQDQRTWSAPTPTSSPPYSSMTMPPVPSYSSHQITARGSYPSEYPESSQRNVLPDGLASPSSFRSHSSVASHSSTDSSRLRRAAWVSDLYPVSTPLMAGAPTPMQVRSRALPATSPRIKAEEQQEGAFIFEMPTAEPNPECEPMPEMPLRAAHACKAMRRMMGSFRLDPFAMHNGIRSAAVAAPPVGIEIGPLRVEPVLIEWQLELDEPRRTPSPASDWTPAPRTVLYPLEDHQLDEKWMPALNYQGFASVNSPDFEPLMTPAQSLNWIMSYPGDGAVQPLSGGSAVLAAPVPAV